MVQPLTSCANGASTREPLQNPARIAPAPREYENRAARARLDSEFLKSLGNPHGKRARVGGSVRAREISSIVPAPRRTPRDRTLAPARGRSTFPVGMAYPGRFLTWPNVRA